MGRLYGFFGGCLRLEPSTRAITSMCLLQYEGWTKTTRGLNDGPLLLCLS